MTPYVVLLSFAYMFFAIAGKNRKKENIFTFILIVAMMLLCGFRGMYCGTDNISYYEIWFGNVRNFKIEILFDLFIKAFTDFYMFMLCFAIASYLPLYWIVKKETIYGTLAMIIFMISSTKFFPESFNVIRQFMGGVLMLGAFVLWKNNKVLLTFVMVAVATMFHTSSLLVLPFLFLRKVDCPAWLAMSLLIITYFVGSLNLLSPVIRLIALGFSVFWNNGELGAELARYATYGWQSRGTTFLSMLFETFPITVMGLICYPFNKKSKEEYGFYYIVFLITTCLGNIMIPSMKWGFRIVFALQFVQILILPMCFQYGNKLQRQIIVPYIIVLTGFYIRYLDHLYTHGIRAIVPYETWLG